MVSIIICSRSKSLSEELIYNIKETISSSYEVILIDNSDNRYSIFSAYNLGAERSKYDILCFMHEDILFKSKGWGIVVQGLLASPTVGVIGVAGAKLKTKSPSPWWIANGYRADEHLRYNIIQKRETGWCHEFYNPSSSSSTEVAILDGVWLCCKKSVWEQVKFDDTSFSGFHFYDLDFCVRALELGYKNFVTLKVLIEHCSTGNANADWLGAADIFHNKWKHLLPITTQPLEPNTLAEIEYQARKSYLWLLIKHRYGSLFKNLKLWLQLAIHKVPSKDEFRQLYSILRHHNKVF